MRILHLPLILILGLFQTSEMEIKKSFLSIIVREMEKIRIPI